MIALAIEKPDAANGITFNAVSDRGVTFNGLVKFCAAAAGKEPKIVYYDPKAVGVDAKKAFPFRNMVICLVFTLNFFHAELSASWNGLGNDASHTHTHTPPLHKQMLTHIHIGNLLSQKLFSSMVTTIL